MIRFDIKDIAEKVVLTFDFSAGLAVGETITSVQSTLVSVLVGRDAAPQSILNGSANIDGTGTLVFVPVQNGIDGCDYTIKAVCVTSNASKILALSAILPVRAVN